MPAKKIPQFLFVPVYLVSLMWLILLIERVFSIDLNVYGIQPRTLHGLWGLLCSPLLHAGIAHLFSNSIPLLVLMMGLFYFHRDIAWRVLLIGVLATNLSVWLFARPGDHIGASGVVYLLASFLFFSGLISRNFRLMALSLIISFLYGGMVWGVLPINPRVSFEAHLSGGVIGLVLALHYPKHYPAPEEIDLDAGVDDSDPYWKTDYSPTPEKPKPDEETN